LIPESASDFSKIAALICIPGKENPQKRQQRMRMEIGRATLAVGGRVEAAKGVRWGMGRLW
jgi:hypothetical protein